MHTKLTCYRGCTNWTGKRSNPLASPQDKTPGQNPLTRTKPPYVNTYIHTYAHNAYLNTYMHACIRTYIHTGILTCICIHTYIPTYIYTYIHTYTHTYLLVLERLQKLETVC